MKRVFLLLPFVFATVLLLAQQPNLLRNSQYLGFEGHKVNLSNSSTMVIWNDTSSGNSDILAQKISSLGNVLWPSARSLVSKPYDQRISQQPPVPMATSCLLIRSIVSAMEACRIGCKRSVSWSTPLAKRGLSDSQWSKLS